MNREPVDEDDYFYLDRRDLKARGIVRDDSELDRLIKTKGFPPGLKTGTTYQAKIRWRKSQVFAWLDAQEARRNNLTYKAGDDNPPPRRVGRPRKQSAVSVE